MRGNCESENAVNLTIAVRSAESDSEKTTVYGSARKGGGFILFSSLFFFLSSGGRARMSLRLGRFRDENCI